MCDPSTMARAGVDYSFTPSGAAGNAEIKQKVMTALLSAGVNANAEQVDGGYTGGARPYIGAEMGPLSLKATRNMGGFIDNGGETYGQDAYNSYDANINSNIGDVDFNLGAEKNPFGTNYNAGASIPALGGDISGSVNRFNPASGKPDTNAMIRYQRKF